MYKILQPRLDGVLSDDHLYFEGLQRPSALFLIRDAGDSATENIEILEKYLADIYNLFLRKLSVFIAEESVTSEESLKLQGLLQELVKVKNLIEGAARAADEKTAD